MIKVTWEQSSQGLIKIPVELKEKLEKVRGQSKEIRISIEPVYQTRTTDQNSYFHSKIGLLAYETGAKKEDLKENIKWYAVRYKNYPLVTVNGKKEPLSVSKANVEQMTNLIDSIFEYAFNQGIYLEE